MEKVSYPSNVQKDHKRCINNYRPVFLLPVCGKIFERILYNTLFLYLESNNLLTPHQSGFRSNDSSYTNYCQLYIAFMQILIITHHLKFEGIFWISQKCSTKYGMKVYYTNLNLIVFQEILTYFAVSLMIDIKEQLLMVSTQIGYQFQLEFHKVPSQDHYYSLFT